MKTKKTRMNVKRGGSGKGKPGKEGGKSVKKKMRILMKMILISSVSHNQIGKKSNRNTSV